MAGRTHLGWRVDPDGGVKQDVVTQLSEQRGSVGQTVEVLGDGQELLQHAAREVGARRLQRKRSGM